MEVMNLVEKALNVRAFYHKILSGNVANVETPHFKEKDIDFREEIGKRLAGPQEITVKENTDGDGLQGIDGNTVNIENQIIKLTENHMMFNSLVQVLTKKFSLMRYVINDGR